MNLYFADNGYLIKTDHDFRDITNILVAYSGGGKIVENHFREEVRLFLDSGAYSAWSKGVEIDINKYIDFIKSNESSFNIYANLDVIGDAEKTLENQKHMESKGLSPLPIYHRGEDVKYLEYYAASYQYIGLGGMVGTSTAKLEPWLDEVWGKYLINRKIKVHGFGLTSVRLMKKYPWTSVDSTSWVLTGRFGGVYCDVGDYSKIIVSSDGDTSKASHFKQLPKYAQEKMREYFRNIGKGYEIEELASTYQLRDEVNILYFMKLQEELTKNPPQFVNNQIAMF